MPSDWPGNSGVIAALAAIVTVEGAPLTVGVTGPATWGASDGLLVVAVVEVVEEVALCDADADEDVDEPPHADTAIHVTRIAAAVTRRSNLIPIAAPSH